MPAPHPIAPTFPDHAALRTGILQRFWGDPTVCSLLASRQRVAVGVSGGADSVALLWLLAAPSPVRPDWAPRVIAAHINHGLRGAESDADEELARRLAGALGLVFRSRRLDGAALRTRKGGSLEAAAREARYRALADIVRRNRCDALVLAHHRDDLAETFLIRLLRGSGLTGLAAFGPVAEVNNLTLLRPLLDWSRDDLRATARAAGLRWNEDASNRDEQFMRNRLRARIMPCLEDATDHPPAAAILAATARRLQREAAALESLAEERYRSARLKRIRPPRLGLPLSSFGGEQKGLGPYLVRKLLCDLAETPYPPEEARVLEILQFIEEGRAETMLQTVLNVVLWIGRDGAIWAYRKPRRNIPRAELVRVFRKL